MMENSSENIKAYTEVNCLLEYLPQSYIDRLPRKLIDLIKGQSDKRYNINIDTDKSLLDQGFSKKAKDLITVLYYNYWTTNEEKQQLTLKIEKFVEKTDKTFKKEINENGCIGSISELYDSAKPHLPKGAFAQAWSVAEVFRIIMSKRRDI